MIGSQNFLTSELKIQEREIGLKTNNLNILQNFNSRFEDSPSLDQPEINNRRRIPRPKKHLEKDYLSLSERYQFLIKERRFVF